MFLKQSPVSYRVKKSRVGKKLKNHTRLFFVVGAVLLAAILTVIWGTVWGEKAQESAQRRAERRAEELALTSNIPDWLPVQPDPIRASYLGKLTTLDAATAAVVALTEGGAEAISVPLYEDGIPQYDSPVAQTLGRQAAGDSDITLARLFAAMLADDCYIAATFACRWQEEPDTALRRVARTYEAALVAEIAGSGANEVLLTGLTVTEETMSEVALFLREIRESCPDAVIGVSVPTALMLEDHYVETMRLLLTWADHVALDLSDYNTHTIRHVDEDGNITRTGTTMEQTLELLDHAITRYRMRLALPAGMYEQLVTIRELGYDNWQIIR